jgi:cysteinyl-tRNA synthetase
LQVRAPDVLTRVTEYIPQIVTYVEQIIGNGYACAF